MYEDPPIEESVFLPGARIFCIASAGCTAMALAARHRVTAVDINPVQLAYARRAPRRRGRWKTGTAERVMGAAAQAPAARRLGAARRCEAFLALGDPAEQLVFWRERAGRCAVPRPASTSASPWVAASAPSTRRPFLQMLPPHFGRVMRGRMEALASAPTPTGTTRTRTRSSSATPRRCRCDVTRAGRRNRALVEADCRRVPRSPAPPVASTASPSRTSSTACRRATGDRLLRGGEEHAAAPGSFRGAAELRRAPGPRVEGNWAAFNRSMLWGVVEARAAGDL